MAEITANMVKELRESTGLGMMECKKALQEANGDMKAAVDLLRIKSGAKADKAASRTAAEGVVCGFIAAGGRTGALIEVNCETDFVAKNPDFVALARNAAEVAARTAPADVAALGEAKLSSGATVEEARKALVQKLGENISVRRFTRFATDGRLVAYHHPNAEGAKIGVIVDLSGDESLGKDLAMHIAASKPICVSREQIPAEVLDRERAIYRAQAAESGKPANIVEKMVDGRVAKFFAEVTLLGQPFVKNPDQTIEQLLKSSGAKVNTFSMYVVGEGIEKKVTDFAAEVAAITGQDK